LVCRNTEMEFVFVWKDGVKTWEWDVPLWGVFSRGGWSWWSEVKSSKRWRIKWGSDNWEKGGEVCELTSLDVSLRYVSCIGELIQTEFSWGLLTNPMFGDCRIETRRFRSKCPFLEYLWKLWRMNCPLHISILPIYYHIHNAILVFEYEFIPSVLAVYSMGKDRVGDILFSQSRNRNFGKFAFLISFTAPVKMTTLERLWGTMMIEWIIDAVQEIGVGFIFISQR
jgi:hypothetical protein